VIQRQVLRLRGIVLAGPPLQDLIDPILLEDLGIEQALAWPDALQPDRLDDTLALICRTNHLITEQPDILIIKGATNASFSGPTATFYPQ